MLDYSMFKTVLVKGFDKDDVLEYIKKTQDETYAKEAEFTKVLKEKDAKIEELNKRILLKEEQKERLENEIEQKYKKYIENYDRIGRLVFESELKADAIIEEANDNAEKIVEAAKAEAERIVAEAQGHADQIMNAIESKATARVGEVEKEVNDKLAEGKNRYLALQDEMNEIVELMNQAQKRFMASYKEVHGIIRTMPTTLKEISDEDFMADIDFEAEIAAQEAAETVTVEDVEDVAVAEEAIDEDIFVEEGTEQVSDDEKAAEEDSLEILYEDMPKEVAEEETEA